MVLLSQIGCIAFLLTIFVQDLIERKVYLWIFISAGVFMSHFHFRNLNISEYLWNCSINMILIGILYIILYLYSNIKLKQPLSKGLGMGDLIFFIIIALSFPPATFSILFVFSLLFSLILFSFFKRRMYKEHVPLAGLQALFFALILISNWTFNFINLYQL